MKTVTRLFFGFTVLVIAGALYWGNSRLREIPAVPDQTGSGRPEVSVFRMDESLESAESAAPEKTEETRNDTGLPLKLPPGFSISFYAKNLP